MVPIWTLRKQKLLINMDVDYVKKVVFKLDTTLYEILNTL